MSKPPEFPVDLPGNAADARPALAWTATILGVAALSLAGTNAISIENWSADLPPSPGVARVLDDAGQWRAATDRVGLGAPRASMHRMWKAMEAADWPGGKGGDATEHMASR